MLILLLYFNYIFLFTQSHTGKFVWVLIFFSSRFFNKQFSIIRFINNVSFVDVCLFCGDVYCYRRRLYNYFHLLPMMKKKRKMMMMMKNHRCFYHDRFCSHHLLLMTMMMMTMRMKMKRTKNYHNYSSFSHRCHHHTLNDDRCPLSMTLLPPLRRMLLQEGLLELCFSYLIVLFCTSTRNILLHGCSPTQ